MESTPARRKPGVNSVISTWAVSAYNLKTMCLDGYQVYEAILDLEAKGKTPEQIVKIMKKTSPQALDFVYEKAADNDDLPYSDEVEETIACLDDILAGKDNHNNNIFVDLSKPFEDAIGKEIKRLQKVLKEIEVADPYGKTPVFTKKRNGKVVLTFK